ncbi:HAD-IC family P-type ATPase [Streptomyces pactum]|uniref:HAD-IC family P-type ATPase n=1 Tax=Streptomyces pactum TaxID=68249 RepID=UPI0036F65FB2
MLRLPTRPSRTPTDEAPGGPARALGWVAPAAGIAARLAVEAAQAGLRTTTGVATAAAGAGRVARNAMTPGDWRTGSRLHVPLRPAGDAADGPDRGADTATGRDRAPESAARRVARTLREHPEVVSAYWDGGLGRLVVRVTEEAFTDEVTDRVERLAARYGLERPDEQVLERAHPGAAGDVRAQALALACDTAGIVTAVAGRTAGLRGSPRAVTAAMTLLREDSRVRGALRRRLGAPGTEAVLAAANAAVHGFGQSPAALVLDAALRAVQLTEALARGTAFDAAHDRLCAPGRVSVSGQRIARPRIVRTRGQEYADQAVTGSAVGAAATWLFTRSTDEAARAVLAGSPKAARYGPVAFTAALGTALARRGVLVRDPERLRQLERVDTLVLHPGSLHGDRRTVLEVRPGAPDWDHDRLWHAARAALRGPGPAGTGTPERAADPGRTGDTDRAGGPDPSEPAADPGTEPEAVELLAAPGAEPGPSGWMIASHRGEDVGTVLVGWEPDPLADALLDAARQAGLRVVLPDDPSLRDLTPLADQVVPVDRAPADVVTELREQGAVVMTVARVPAGGTPAEGLDDRGRALLAGLRAGHLAVALTDDGSAVVWGADALVQDGPEGVWRLLSAIPAAREAGRRSRTLAQAGAALAGLMVMSGASRPGRSWLALGRRIGPVNAAAAAALLTGRRAAVRVAAAPPPRPRPQVAWHALRPEEVRARLAGTPRRAGGGWTAARSAVRTTADRALRLPVLAPARLPARLLSAVRAELDDPLTPLLAVGAAASAVLGAPVDALLVAGAMGVNALVGGVQRLRAERALTSLAAGQRRRARRVDEHADEAGPVTVEAAGLKPGEVIELHTGDVVPADARLLEVDGLEVDESALTGESLPVTKETGATPRAELAERRCMVFEGTTVVAGRARAVVVGTGEQTEAGRAAHLAARSRPAGGVQARLHELTRKVLPLTLAGGAAVTALSLLRGRPAREALSGGVAVAVAAVPEGLPLVATVAQMAAARRLSRRGVLVRTPRALEALGRMDTICFDKTGTLTENRLHVSRTVTADGTTEAADTPGTREVLRWAALACPPPGDGAAQAHATDAAVLAAAPEDTGWQRLDALPFEASRSYAGAVARDTDGTTWLVVKGAPEVVLPACAGTGGGTDVPGAVRDLADEGLRIIAVARRRLAPEEVDGALERPLEDMEPAGFVALADTPRAGSAPLVAELLGAGVRPVMLTGDHPHTARAIALDLGWPKDVTVVTGEELTATDRAGRARLLAGCGVIARVAPEQKLQVVEALREAGRVVAMVGDGANDAAAIRAADVGVGVAARGSAAARNAADLVLTDDELTPLIAAVEEGRALWRSVADAVAILTGGNAGEVGFTVLGTLLSGASPLSTRQMLLVNLLTDMFPAMAVAVTPQDEPQNEPEAGEATGGGSGETTGQDTGTGPARPGISALGDPLTRKIRRRGITTSLGAGTAWLLGSLTPGTARRTSTMALCGLVGAQLVQTLAGRRRSPLVLTTVAGSAAALFALVQTPGVSHFFGCTPLGPVAWAGVAAAVGVASLGPVVTGPLERLLPRGADAVPAPVREVWTRLTGTVAGGATA